MDVSVIIVNYNTKELVIQCIKSIKEYTKSVSYEIIVVDNASTDDSVIALEDVSEITLLKSNVNLGFGKANNLGAKNAEGEFVFFLNSDTILVEDSVSKLWKFYMNRGQDLKLGVLGCLLTDLDGNINGFGDFFPTPREAMLDKLRSLPMLRQVLPKKKVFIRNKNDQYFEIDYVIGADMFLRKSLFDSFAGFDERFFMYYEESDFQIKVKEAGYKNCIVSDTKIIHLEDGTGKRISAYSNKKRIILHESRITYMKSNFSDQYRFFRRVDSLFLFLSAFDFKYSLKENLGYIKHIKKIY